MNAPEQPGLPANGQFLVYQAEDGQVKIDVRLQGETAWLTQAHMAELFQTTIPNVSMHLRNIYAEGELQPEATIQEFLIVRPEGSRQVSRSVEHYNLAAIISVGYRVKSAVATRFPIWATQNSASSSSKASSSTTSASRIPLRNWPSTASRKPTKPNSSAAWRPSARTSPSTASKAKSASMLTRLQDRVVAGYPAVQTEERLSCTDSN